MCWHSLQPQASLLFRLAIVGRSAESERFGLDVRQFFECQFLHGSNLLRVLVAEVCALGRILGQVDKDGTIARAGNFFCLVQIQLSSADAIPVASGVTTRNKTVLHQQVTSEMRFGFICFRQLTTWIALSEELLTPYDTQRPEDSENKQDEPNYLIKAMDGVTFTPSDS